MHIEYGANVVDKSGVVLGTVDYIIRNTWTGEISKFRVKREKPNKELFFSPKDIQDIDESAIHLAASNEHFQ